MPSGLCRFRSYMRLVGDLVTEQWGVLMPWDKEPVAFRTREKALSYFHALNGKELVRRDGARVRAEGLRLFRRQIPDWEEMDLD